MTDSDRTWGTPPPDLRLSGEQVHVWRASLEQPAAVVCRLAQTLCGDELDRESRFRLEHDRRRFIVGRGILRILLGRHLDVESQRVRLQVGPRGKPHLSGSFGPGAPRFNLAHTQALALYAFVAGREVGIDAEYIRPVPDAAEIAARSFSARENAALLRLPDDQRQEAVFRCWTRKEAFIKAIGDGLAHPLAGFDVTLTPDEPPLLSIEGDPEKAARWSLEAFVPATAYLAALAVEGPDWHSVFWQYR